MANVTSRLLLLPVALLSVTLAGCASAAMKAGQQADMLKDYDRAVVEYTKALREHPDDRAAKQALDVAKIRAALDHYARARRYENSGRLDEALVELQVAYELNPGNADVDDALRNVRA